MKKIFLALLCFLMLLAAAACTSQPSQKTYEEQKALYGDIISQYTALLTAKHNGEELPVLNTDGMDEGERAIAETLHGIVDACKDAEAAGNLGYGYKDFDGNGTPELVLLTKYTPIRAIFTLSGDKPILLEANYGAGGFTFATGNRFFIVRVVYDGNIEEVTYYTCRVEGDKMVYDSVYGEAYDHDKKEYLGRFQIVDGNRISIDEATFKELDREHSKVSFMDYTITSKLLSPRIYLPLADSVTDEALPVADFSSYASIRETYKAILNCIEKFDVTDWSYGEYDNLFSFPNDISFEYCNRLLYQVYSYGGNRRAGYDEIDLNGDGLDELLLLGEDYNIRAIFTQKDGVPELLGVSIDAICWLDDQGLIHVDCIDYYELEYSLYEFTQNGDHNLVYSLLIADNGNRYLTQNGKTEIITFEKSLEIYYDDYCRYPEPFEPNEYTRNVSELTYTPLTAPAEDLTAAAVGKTWYKNANLEKTTGNKWGAYGNTYVSFENPTDTQVDVKIKYEYTTYYPDPDRENYMLDETTVSYLDVTARAEDGVFVFEGNGIKGRLEFGNEHMWLIIEESTDERFTVGFHCFEEYTQGGVI